MFCADVATWFFGIVGLFAIGFFGIIAVLAAAVTWAFRWLLGLEPEPRRPRAVGPPRAVRGRAVCPHPRCGHLNPHTALYCARCGRPLKRAYELDAYG